MHAVKSFEKKFPYTKCNLQVSFSDITLVCVIQSLDHVFLRPLGCNLNLFTNEQDIDANCGINVFASTTRYVLCDIQCAHPRAPFD